MKYLLIILIGCRAPAYGVKQRCASGSTSWGIDRVFQIVSMATDREYIFALRDAKSLFQGLNLVVIKRNYNQVKLNSVLSHN